jgi:hypothetical protein
MRILLAPILLPIAVLLWLDYKSRVRALGRRLSMVYGVDFETSFYRENYKPLIQFVGAICLNK